uniref:Uncharacterized protein n=1 Tax=Chromera velia CCMP2878 TaxID=1169474 RepID=A0A0G4G576_9ALVE|eukprot:Cvel_20238.t1-p1 / transcript=Cvel_20238.t1 / gene=Cvel_20238 / organism=Chromera_velia_CCMP2878 / gene_product=hypothetical protein / transcript_product=hypothetical protein / location=Cvel_scaffold1803:24134-24436(+) / protein_length=101 / sequence_SO=supercontig / SO=protein_coding / is_pseudo=false
MLKTDYEGETMEEKEVTLDLTEYGKIAKEVRVRCNKETNSPEKGIKYEHPMGGPVYSLTAYAKGTVLDTYSGKVGDFAMESGCLPDVVEIVKSKFPEETTE